MAQATFLYRRQPLPLKDFPSHFIMTSEISERRDIGLWRAEAGISIARISAPISRLSADGHSRN
jgi:hypothetical protein